MDSYNKYVFPQWFENLSKLGGELALLHKTNFAFCICLPTIKFSTPAILLGLIKKYLQIQLSINSVEQTLESLPENTVIKFHDFNNKVFNAHFLGLEDWDGELMVRLKIKKRTPIRGTKNLRIKDYNQLLPVKRQISRVFIYRQDQYIDSSFPENKTQRKDKHKVGIEIKDSYSGFENLYLNTEEVNELKTSHSAKILIIGQKNTLKDELISFNICNKDQDSSNYNPQKVLGSFNDIIRARDFVNEGESFFSTITSPLSPKDYSITKDIRFKIYLGSNSFIKLQEDDDEKASSIIIISPEENNFENSVYAFQKRFSERRYTEFENFDSIKNLNLNLPAMVFRER